MSMKSILLTVCVFAMTSVTHAQLSDIGIRAGWNSTSVTGDDLGNVSSKSDFYAGVYKEFNLLPKLLYLVPELQYSRQGFKSDISGSEKSYSLDYVNIPVLAKVYVIKILSFEAGPQIGFKVSDNLEGADTESFDTSLAAGVGFHLPLGFSINARYLYGMTKIIKDSDAKNEVIQVGAAFKF